jgi:D-3-phosphoglycerate dehydrogenase
LVTLDELCARSDIVVSCAALTDTSRGLIDAATIAKMRPGVIVVNVSRGGVVVEDALVDALDSGHVAYAALDVRSPEPPDPAHDRITSRSDVLLTQHIAASSVESIAGLHVEAANQIIAMLRQAGRLPAA